MPRNPATKPDKSAPPDTAREWCPLNVVPDRRPYATVRWLRTLAADKRIPVCKAGRKVFVDLKALDAYMEACVIDPEAS